MIRYGMAIKRTSHAVYETTYHLVWCPKYRRDIFKTREIRVFAQSILGRVCEEYRIELLELEVTTDHIHAMVSFPPSMSIGEVVRKMKSISARETFQKYPELKRRLWAGELWEDGYFARTVGDRMTSEIVKNYIKMHGQRERGPKQLQGKLL
ncbi:MAG: IS200/IS605 family transposase [Victivallaceae bacterium]|nr:IS200/IS605 family transposase [Victivallaceae bacterium]